MWLQLLHNERRSTPSYITRILFSLKNFKKINKLTNELHVLSYSWITNDYGRRFPSQFTGYDKYNIFQLSAKSGVVDACDGVVDATTTVRHSLHIYYFYLLHTFHYYSYYSITFPRDCLLCVQKMMIIIIII